MSVPVEVAAPGHEIAAGEPRLVAILGRPVKVRGWCPARASTASVNNAGDVAFVADAAGPASASALVHVSAGGGTQVLLRAGEPAPGGGRYASFGELDLGGGGQLLFQARLTGSEAAEGLFLHSGSEVRALARAGDAAPGGGQYAGFRQLTLASYPQPTSPPGARARLAYAARTTDGRTSLVIWPAGRDPSRIMATGSRVDGGVLEDFSLSRLGPVAFVIARIRYGTTKRRIALLASEDQLTSDEWLRDGGRLPGVGVISRLAIPPAVWLQQGFLCLALDDGEQALATRPATGGVRVLARSGDPAPGLAGRWLAKLGPPVTNSGVPGGECGVVAAVQLTGGQAALWSMAGSGPPTIRLAAGDRIAGEPAARVQSLTPVKLTDTGALLLISTIDLGGRLAEGLLLCARLFG